MHDQPPPFLEAIQRVPGFEEGLCEIQMTRLKQRLEIAR
jgi:hypothetical protein